ncbi:MAG TPA: FG-GAP-like repeat-containing protein, partial [Chitinophagaceae bacterium]|nr:FG-GAP-like repeat-containing protein [Chitinophagaceae bacterium]
LSARRIFISKNNGAGIFSAPIIKEVNPFPSCIAAADFNKDGRIDITTGQSLSVDVDLNNGSPTIFADPVSYKTEGSPYDIMVADFNKDGNLDIATCTEYNFEGMSVLLGNGNGTFQPAQNYKGAYSPDLRNESGITSGDVDGDGDEDIIVGNYASNDVSIYLNTGNGTFIFKARAGIYYGVEAPVYADFTGDGKKDIAALISLPPSGIQSSLAVLHGNVMNNTIAANNKSNDWKITAKQNDDEVSVLNNPFTNYIDVKFAKAPAEKVLLRLTDISGRLIETHTFNSPGKSLLRLNITNGLLSRGLYILTVETANKKYVFRAVH